MFVTEIRPLNKKKSRILFDDGEDLVLYNGEIRASRIKDPAYGYFDTPTFIHLYSLKTVALIEGDVLRTIRKSV